MNTPRALAGLTAVLLLTAACAGASTTPTLRAASPTPPEATESETVEPSPTPTPEPSVGAWGGMYANFGAHAVITVDRLRLRQVAGTSFDPLMVMTAGQDLLLVSGPVTIDGYDWYEVEVFDDDADGFEVGWLAALPADAGPNPPDDAWLIDIGSLRCPEQETVDTALLARLTGYAIDQCGVRLGEASGMVDLCYEGPISPYSYKPNWVWFSCYFLRDEARTWYLPIYFPPDFADEMPERGDLVTVTGRLGFNKDKYGECTVTAEEAFPASSLSAERQRYAASCAQKFVVSSMTVTGHVELPPMY